MNLGTFLAEDGDAAGAEAEYREALRLERDYVPAWVNLADLFRARGREDDAVATLEQGLAATADDPSLLHALGLARVRAGRYSDAIPLFARAAAARPDDARFAYVHAVALYDAGRGAEAMQVLRAGLERSPFDRDLLAALALYGESAAGREAASGTRPRR